MNEASLQNVTGPSLPRWIAVVLGLCLMMLAWGAAADPSKPTDAEQRWIDAFYAFVETGDPDEGLIHQKRLARESLRPFQLSAEQFKFFDALPIAKNLLTGMWQDMTEDTWVTFLRMRDLEDGRVAQFRFHGDDGLTYIEWYLEAKPGGDVWAWDFHNYVTGEKATQTLRRLWLPAVAELDEEIRKHMGHRNRELAANIMRLIDIKVSASEGDHAKAIQIYEGLPDSVQEDRVFLVYAMQSYFALEKEKAYLALLEKFLELHGESSNRELMLMDVYIYREEYDKSMQMVDDLDKRVGGDVFLESFRAGIAYITGDYKKTKAFYDRGIQSDPSQLDFYWESIDYALAEEDWVRISVMLDAAQVQGSELYPLSEVEGYEPYLATDEYQRWLALQTQAVQDEQRGIVAEDQVKEAE